MVYLQTLIVKQLTEEYNFIWPFSVSTILIILSEYYKLHNLSYYYNYLTSVCRYISFLLSQELYFSFSPYSSLSLYLERLLQKYTDRLKFCRGHQMLHAAEEIKPSGSKQKLCLIQSSGYDPIVKSSYYIQGGKKKPWTFNKALLNVLPDF